MLITAEKDYEGFWKITSYGPGDSYYSWQWRFTSRKSALTLGVDMFLDTRVARRLEAGIKLTALV